jgi:hypothetical protein
MNRRKFLGFAALAPLAAVAARWLPTTQLQFIPGGRIEVEGGDAVFTPMPRKPIPWEAYYDGPITATEITLREGAWRDRQFDRALSRMARELAEKIDAHIRGQLWR